VSNNFFRENQQIIEKRKFANISNGRFPRILHSVTSESVSRGGAVTYHVIAAPSPAKHKAVLI
jgi:hypothetical protein